MLLSTIGRRRAVAGVASAGAIAGAMLFGAIPFENQPRLMLDEFVYC